MQIPIDIQIIVEVMPHERLIGEFWTHQPSEERSHLIAIHRSIQIRSDSREVDPFAEVIVTTVLLPEVGLQRFAETLIISREKRDKALLKLSGGKASDIP